jgi:hypothetical protein
MKMGSIALQIQFLHYARAVAQDASGLLVESIARDIQTKHAHVNPDPDHPF